MTQRAPNNLKEFLKILSDRGLLKCIDETLDPKLEIPEIHRRVIEKGGPALLFRNPKGSKFPLVTNLFGTMERVDLAFGEKPKLFVKQMVELLDQLVPPKFSTLIKSTPLLMQALKTGTRTRSKAPILESGPLPPFFTSLPVTTSWPEDGGPFHTLPLVYTQSPSTGKHNLGIYRMQVYDDNSTGMHWQIHKGGGFHYSEAQKLGQKLPVAVFNGGPPALMLAAIAPLPEDVPELLLASILMGGKINRTHVPNFPLPLIGECEFAFTGYVAPTETKAEGPFGDHYGYYSLKHDYPVFKADKFYHRKDAIYCATVVGEPRQEDFYLGDYLQELLSPAISLAMPAVKEIHAYGETGFHSLAAAKVKNRYPRELFATGLRILGEGQLSLTKVLMLTDSGIPFRPFDKFLEHFLAHSNLSTDIRVLPASSQDTLDYTGPKVNEGSKLIWSCTGTKAKELEIREPATISEGVRGARLYCPGCLVLEGSTYTENKNLGDQILLSESMSSYPLIILVDSLEECLRNEMSFLWVVFTRFEPARDIKVRDMKIENFQPQFSPPLLIDARMKPWYPGKLVMTPEVIHQVDTYRFF